MKTALALGLVGLALMSAGFRSTLDDGEHELDGGIEDASGPEDATFDVELEPGEPIKDEEDAGRNEDAGDHEEDAGAAPEEGEEGEDVGSASIPTGAHAVAAPAPRT